MHDEQRFEQARAAFLSGLDSQQAGHLTQAEAHYLQSLQCLPGRPSTLINLAATQLRLGKPREALVHADAALAAEPGSGDALLHRATALATLGLPLDALQAFDALLAQRPDHAGAWSARGSLLRELHRLDEAAHAFGRALALGGDAQLNGYYLAAVQGGQGAPAASPAPYVQGLFDQYAADFDAHLVQALQYRGHERLVQVLADTSGRAHATAIDLGCGTGLCGGLLRPMVHRLVGVDLSAGMLAKARALGAYDRLDQGDAVQFLHAGGEEPTLLLAADVFIYIGDLQALFTAAAAAMPRGVLCFSVEELEHPSLDFQLQPSLRYAQSRRYLEQLASRNGFQVLAMQRDTVRSDQRAAVPGLYVVMQRG